MSSEATGVPLTLAEQTAFRQTGRTDEVERLCQALRGAGRMQCAVSNMGGPPKAARCGRWCVARGPVAGGAARRRVPVLMIQAGIHPGESDGKDAGFIALREMLNGDVRHGALDRSPFCSCRRSTPTATSASAAGIGRTRSARRKWAGARRRRT